MNSSYKSNTYTILLAPNAQLSGTVSVFEPPIMDTGGKIIEFGGGPPGDELPDQSDTAPQNTNIPDIDISQPGEEISLGEVPEVFVGGSGPGVY